MSCNLCARDNTDHLNIYRLVAVSYFNYYLVARLPLLFASSCASSVICGVRGGGKIRMGRDI